MQVYKFGGVEKNIVKFHKIRTSQKECCFKNDTFLSIRCIPDKRLL